MKKILSVVQICAMALSFLGAPILFPTPARAAVTAGGIYDQIPAGGIMVPVSSFDTPLLRFTLVGDGTLSSVALTVINNTGGAVADGVLAGHLAALRVFKDVNGNNSFDPMNDLMAGEQTTANIGSATTITTGSNNSYSASGGMPTSFFVALRTGASWAIPDSILINMAATGVTTSEGAATVVALAGSRAIYAGSSGYGGYGSMFNISKITFVNATTLDVSFNDNLDTMSGKTTSTARGGNASYTLNTAAGGNNNTITSVALLSDNKSVRITATTATIVSAGTDTITVSNLVKNYMGTPNGSTTAMPIMSDMQPLIISEIKIGTASDADDEFIEIYNRSGGAFSVSGLKLHLVNATGTADTNASLAFLDGVTEVPSHGFILIAPRYSPASSTADAIYTTSTSARLVPSGAAYLSYSTATSTAVIDKVCWGSHAASGNCEGSAASGGANDGTSLERKAFNASTALTMAVGGADAAMGNSVDTQYNLYDFVARTTPLPQNSTTGGTETPLGGAYGGTSNQAPNISHGPIFRASRASALNLLARISDDGGSVPAGNTKLIFCVTSVTCTPDANNPIYGVSIGSGWYKFSSTTTNTWGGTKSYFKYYLQAADSASPAKTTVLTNDPNYDTVTYDHTSAGIGTNELKEAKALVVSLEAGALGSASISGQVNNSTSGGVSGATVWIEGTQFAATTGNDGAFSFSNVGPAGGAQIKIAKEGYMDQSISTYIPSTGIVTLSTVTLYSGVMGQGGDFNMPRVTNSFPMNGMNSFPTQTPSGSPQFIEVNFSKSMDSTTIVDADASDASSNIYLTLAGSGTKIAGAVTAPTSTQVRFTPSAALTVGAAYTLSITPAVKDSVGNPVSGNGAGGVYVLSFSTAGQMFENVGAIGGNYGMGSAFPPYVIGAQPSPGKISIPTNTKAAVIFSEAMQNSSTNLANVKLYKISNAYTASEGKTSVSTTNSLDASNKIVILAPTAVLDASSQYRIEVLGSVASAKGIPIGNPSQSSYTSSIVFKSDFTTGSGTDSTAPTVDSTIPAASATGISTVRPIVITFSEAINPSTITDTSVSLKLGSMAIDGDLSYDANRWTATFVSNYALTATSTFTISVTTDVQDLAGNALDQDSDTASNQSLLRTFTTASADVSAPAVNSAQANDSAMKVIFSKSMLAVAASDSNYASSVLNPSNYTVKVVNSSGTTLSSVTLPSTTTLDYDPATRSVAMNGLPSITGFSAGSTLINVKVSNVKDVAFNNLSTAQNAATTTAQSSATTGNFSGGGMMMPMIDSSGNMMQGAMFGPPPTAIKTFTDSGIGFIPSVNVFPFSSMAGVKTIYGIEMPISKQIPASGYIEVTFPEGTDLGAAKKDPFSPPNRDLNGHGSGTVVFASDEGTLPSGWTTGGAANDGVIVNSSSPTLRIILGAVATRCGTDNTSPCSSSDEHDFLRLDIADIVNSSSVTKVNTSGNSATVETRKLDGTVIETLTSGSYFTTATGSLTLRGRVLSGVSGLNGVNVFLMSPMSGPQSTSTANNAYGGSSDGEFKFQNLVAGNYMLGAEKVFKSGGTTYTAGFPMPVNLSTTLCANNICTQNVSVADASIGVTVTLNISGTFSNDAVDIFASGPGAYRMATTTLNGILANNTDNTIKLNGNGVWMVGFGPAMSVEIFGKGGSGTQSTWMIPKPQQVMIAGCPAACAAYPSTATFNVSGAGKTVKFTVKDEFGNTIGNAHVFAYSPGAGLGADTNANADGTGSINLGYGTYKMGAEVPGMPNGTERSISIRSISSVDKVFVDGSSTGITLSTMTSANLILTISKPAYTISGRVTDGTNPLANVPVSAYRTNGPGHAENFTNSSGDYTLYVSNGIWKVQAFMSSYGRLPEKTITIAGSNSSNQNFEPNTTSINYGTITKSVAVDTNADGSYAAADDEELANVQVAARGTTSAGEAYVNAALTDTNGSSTLKLPPGTYTIDAFSPKIGKLPAFSSSVVVNSAGTVTTEPANLLAPQTGTVTVNIIDSNGNTTTTPKAAIEFSLIGGRIDKAESFGNVASSTVTLPVYDAGEAGPAAGLATSTSPANFYLMKVNIPGVAASGLNVFGESGTIMATSTAVNGLWKVEVDGNETINVKLPALKFISGTVKDAVGTAVPDATVHLENSSTGETIDVKADVSGNYSAKVSAGTYLMKADKDGYIDTAQSVTINSDGALADSAATITAASYEISGTITVAGTAVSGAAVKAAKLGSGTVTATSDSNGAYTLKVIPGNWKVSASYDGYAEKTNTAVIPVSSANVSSVDVNITVAKSGLADSTSATVTPQTGGALSDSSAGLDINATEAAIAQSANSYSLNEKETSNIVGGAAGKPISGEAKTVTSYDNDGNAVTLLDKDVAISSSYSTADLTSSLTSLTLANIEKVKVGSWDTSTDNWEHLPTTVSYKNSSGNYVEPASDLSNVSTVGFTGFTSHLSVFNPLAPEDGLDPSPPTGLSVARGNYYANALVVSWTAPTKNADTSDLTDLWAYEIYRSTTLNGQYDQINTSNILGTSYTDQTVVTGNTYYYKVTAADTGGIESDFSSPSTGFTVSSPPSSGGGGGVPVQPAAVSFGANPIAASGGKTTIASNLVILIFNAENAANMMVSENADFSGTSWEPYAASKTVGLSAGEGLKKIYAKFKNSSGNESEVKTIDITVFLETAVVASAAAIPAAGTKTAVPVPAAVLVSTASSVSAVSISGISAASFQPGEPLQFIYQYKNESAKPLAIRIYREILNDKGKAVKRLTGYVALKAGAEFKKVVNEAIDAKLPPGDYTVQVRILDAKNKPLADNSFNIAVQKLKMKYFVLGEAPSSEGALVFDAATLAKIKSGIRLPANLRLKYSYENQTSAKQTVKMSRELVDQNGKVIFRRVGRWIMVPGEKDALAFTQAVAGNLPAGDYTIKLTAKDYKTGEVLAENSLNFAIELK